VAHVASRAPVCQYEPETRGPVGQPSSSGVRSCGVPPLSGVGVEVPEDNDLAGKASSDAFADPVQEVSERRQAAVRGDVDSHHRYSGPLDGDVAAATVERYAGGPKAGFHVMAVRPSRSPIQLATSGT
jgi:hypothetical protein